MTVSEAYRGQGGGRVRARILYPFALVILFVIGAFLVAAYVFEDREFERNLMESAASVERLFQQGLENEAAMMQASLAVIARDENIKKAFIGRNRKALQELVRPLFDSLRQNNRVSHFNFIDPDRVNFLRAHKPDKFGDTIDRFTTLRASREGVPSRGIELDSFGIFTLHVVLPWYQGKTLIGFLELGQEIDSIIDEVHRVMGADLLLLVYDRYVDLEQWEVGKEKFGHQNDWPRFGNTVVVGRAMAKIPGAVAEILRRDDHSYERPLHVVEDGRDLYVTFLPLNDITGREVGDFVVVKDITGVQANYRNVTILTAVVSVLVGSLIFAIFYVILGRVEDDYRRQREVELQLARVNTEHQKVIQVEKLSAMGLMISEIAHQLNNPLVGVVNMAQLAEREVGDSERTRELLGDIIKAGRDCHQSVKRMLEFTRISSFDRKLTDMNVLVEETIALFQQSLGKPQNVVSKLPRHAPILDVDPILIKHAVFNLLSNAAQANPPNGTIIVGLYRETQPIDSVPGWSLTISDEGCGLSDEVRDKMFTPFFTTYPEGTGLGLPVVQHVAILHEGRINAANTETGGALFALWLPVTEMDE